MDAILACLMWDTRQFSAAPNLSWYPLILCGFYCHFNVINFRILFFCFTIVIYFLAIANVKIIRVNLFLFHIIHLLWIVSEIYTSLAVLCTRITHYDRNSMSRIETCLKISLTWIIPVDIALSKTSSNKRSLFIGLFLNLAEKQPIRLINFQTWVQLSGCGSFLVN